MSFSKKFKHFCSKMLKSKQPAVSVEPAQSEIEKRIERLERNYIILLKRVLEIDGIQLVTKTSAFSSKLITTPNDDINKGLNEPEPTIH